MKVRRGRVDTSNAVIVGPTRIKEVVYGYRFPSRPDRIKIGYSSRGLKRVAEQSTSFPENPKLIFMIRNPKARAMEGAFHRALSRRRAAVMGTEWFDASWDDILAVSPSLRKAAGASRRRLWMRVAAMGLTGGAAILLAPLLFALSLGVGAGAPALDLLEWIPAYAADLASGDISRVRAAMSFFWESAAARDVSWAWSLPALLVLALVTCLPCIRWRRQAA